MDLGQKIGVRRVADPITVPTIMPYAPVKVPEVERELVPVKRNHLKGHSHTMLIVDEAKAGWHGINPPKFSR